MAITRAQIIAIALAAAAKDVVAKGEHARLQSGYSLWVNLGGRWFVALTSKKTLKHSSMIASAPCVGYPNAAALVTAFNAHLVPHV
jgi:hypothetical protein